MKSERPITIAILAVGGQGGGVLTKWLVDLAEQNGYIAQSTFVAGVAQRTGATVYCVEMFAKEKAASLGSDPIFTPYPVPGDVDLVVVGEMAETGRAIQKGFVTPNLTTLVASGHRLYSIAEKEYLGDGIFDQTPVMRVAAAASKKFICFDMDAEAQATGSVISSVFFGAIAGSGALPFERGNFEATIREAGRAVDASLRGFAAGFDGVGRENSAPRQTATMLEAKPSGANGKHLQNWIDAELPAEIRNVALHGALRALDYQDVEYAQSYLERVHQMASLDSEKSQYALTLEVARQLALQMCYEDTIRVAELKTRQERFEKIRTHVAAAVDQPAHVIEYFHPRLEEVCDTLPHTIGAAVLRSRSLQKILTPFFSKGRNITTTNIGGYLLMHTLAKLRRWRRSSYRFKIQLELIEDWLNRIRNALVGSYDYAQEIAQCIELVKGYGETYHRGLLRYRQALDASSAVAPENRAASMRELRDAALADEQGEVFEETVQKFEATG